MSLHVQGQVVGAGEGPLTEQALVRLLAGVLAEVTRQLIRACKLPPAALPGAVVGLLP